MLVPIVVAVCATFVTLSSIFGIMMMFMTKLSKTQTTQKNNVDLPANSLIDISKAVDELNTLLLEVRVLSNRTCPPTAPDDRVVKQTLATLERSANGLRALIINLKAKVPPCPPAEEDAARPNETPTP